MDATYLETGRKTQRNSGFADPEGGGSLQEGASNAVEDGAHAHVVGVHVEPVHDWRPPDLSWKVCSHQREQHCHNVKHDALHIKAYSQGPDKIVLEKIICSYAFGKGDDPNVKC